MRAAVDTVLLALAKERLSSDEHHSVERCDQSRWEVFKKRRIREILLCRH